VHYTFIFTREVGKLVLCIFTHFFPWCCGRPEQIFYH